MTRNLQIDIYSEMLKTMRLGSRNGKAATSKPILILSIFDSISSGDISDNQILFENDYVRKRYKDLSDLFNGLIKTQFLPLFIRPFFHLGSEPFYELVWKSDERPKMNSHSPSAKYLREYLAYAKLNDNLWALLQEQENRDYLKQVIINRYLHEQL